MNPTVKGNIVDAVLVSAIGFYFTEVCDGACSDGTTTINCSGEWWNSWYIWVFIGTLLSIIVVVILRFVCQRYSCFVSCSNRGAFQQSSNHRGSNCALTNEESQIEDVVSAYCIPLPPDYESLTRCSPPPYHTIFTEARKSSTSKPDELRVSPQDLPSYDDCTSPKSSTHVSLDQRTENRNP